MSTIVVGCIVGYAIAKYNKCKMKRDWEEAERVDVALRTASDSGVKEGEQTRSKIVPRDSGLSIASLG